MQNRSLSFLSFLVVISASFFVMSETSRGDLIDEDALVSRNIIQINGDEEFTSGNGVVSGEGTETNPYIIENWTIDNRGSGMIMISGTDSHVIIRNCMVWGDPGSGPGINIIDAANITIINCCLHGIYQGVMIQGWSSNITVSNSYFNGTDTGLIVHRAGFIVIRDNSFLWNNHSILFEEKVTSSRINGNRIIGNRFTSVDLQEDSNRNHIHNNTISREDEDHPFPYEYNMGYVGLGITESNNNLVEFNNCSNQTTGIAVWGSVGNKLVHNIIYKDKVPFPEGYGIGISIDMSPDTRSEYNSMINCGIVVSEENDEDSMADLTSLMLDETNSVDGRPVKFVKDTNILPDLDKGWGQLIFVNCTDIVISSSSFESSGICITFGFCENAEVRDNDFKDSFCGLYIFNCKNVSIMNNRFEDHFTIASCSYSNGMVFTNNKILNSVGGIGIHSDHVSISNNTFSGVNLTSMRVEGNGNLIQNNSIDIGDTGIQVRENNNTIINNHISSQRSGIIIEESRFMEEDHEGFPGSSDNMVLSNTIESCTSGIAVEGVENSIFNNTLRKGYDGLTLKTDRNLISGNMITDNSERGIYICGSENGIDSNTISGNKIAVHISDDNNLNEITRNIICQNEIGVYLNDEAAKTLVTQNNISSNEGYGVSIHGSSTRNRIYWNTFQGNNDGKVQALDNSSGNIWDDGIGEGNHWGDYVKIYVPPAVHDGKVYNISYRIDGTSNARDRYPLVKPIGSCKKYLKLIIPEIHDAVVGKDYLIEFNVAYAGISPGDIQWGIETTALFMRISEDGKVEGTPEHMGTFRVNVSVSGGGLRDWYNFQFNVTAPRIATSDIIQVYQGSRYEIDYDASSDGDLTWKLKTNSTFISMDSKTGLLSGIPSNDDVGKFWVNVSLFSGDDLYDFTNFTLTVKNVNDPPTGGILNLGVRDLVEGLSQEFSIIVEDPDSVYGDSYNITWYIEGIGIVGYGEKITILLPSGNYSLSISIRDRYDGQVWVNTSFTVKSKHRPEGGVNISPLFYVTAVLLGISAIGIVSFMIRKRKVDNSSSDHEYEPDGEISSPGPVPPGFQNTLPEVMHGEIEPSVAFEGSRDRTNHPIREIASGGYTTPVLSQIADEALAFEKNTRNPLVDIEGYLQIIYAKGNITKKEMEQILESFPEEE